MSHKELVLSFIEVHVSHDVQFDDIVEGKGLGLLMLLDGDPGLGKTLTAEAVAEKVQKPLYLLSVGELGGDAGVSRVETEKGPGDDGQVGRRAAAGQVQCVPGGV